MVSARSLGLVIVALASMMIMEAAAAPGPTEGSLPDDAVLVGSDSAELISNEIVIRLAPASHRDLVISNRGMTNIPSLNSLAAKLGARGMRPVVPRSGPERDLLRWYVVRLGGEPNEILLSDVRNPRSKDPAVVRFREALAGYAADPHVEVAEPNYIVRASVLPNDYYYGTGELWGLRKINAEGAWNLTTGGTGVVVAVSDTGVDWTHPDLVDRMWTNPGEIPGDGIDNDANGYKDDIRGWDFVGVYQGGGSWLEDPDPQDDNAHGTHVAGTIAATGGNHTSGQPSDGKALVGVSWSAKIMALKFLNSGGSGNSVDGAATIDYAWMNGAQVLNMSWGGGGVSGYLEEALREAHDAGVVLVAAAGNSHDDAYNHEPANSPYVITVAATNSQDQRACFSNFGVKIDVGAPGGDSSSCGGRDDRILSALSNQISAQRRQDLQDQGLITDCCYLKLRGTSMATPHVAGLAALIKARNPSFTNEQIRQVLHITADDVGGKPWTRDTGYGRINAAAAVAVATPPPVAWIDTPRYRTIYGVTIIGNSFQVTGKASGASATFVLYVGVGEEPVSWTELASGSANGDLSTQVNLIGLGLRPGSAVTIRLVVTPQTGPAAEGRAKVLYDTEVAPGWPISGEDRGAGEFSNEMAPSRQPAIVDLTGDGSLEVVGLTSAAAAEVHAWNSNAVELWSYSLGQYWAWPTSPLVTDLVPAQPGLETVVVSTTGGYYANVTTAVTVLTATGQLISQGTWTYQSDTCRGADVLTHPTATDTDDLPDGVKEVILSCEFKIVALDPTTGMVKDQSDYSGLLGSSGSGVIVANIDGAGNEEVIVTSGNAISVLDSRTLDLRPGWPLDLSSPWFRVAKLAAVGDIDGDADLEIVIGGVWNDSSIGEIRAYNPDKTPVWGFAPSFGPAPYGAGGLYLTNMDQDQNGTLEIVVHEAGVHVFTAAGEELTGWWDQFGEASVSLSTPGDVDDDGDLEILLVGSGGQLRAYKRFGGIVWERAYGWLGMGTTLPTGPTAADLNGDGVLEIVGQVLDVFASSHKIFDWPLPGVSVPARTVYAPMPGFNAERTGVFTVASAPSVTNDGDGLLDTTEPPGCVGPIDCDGDTVVDGRDNCVTNPNQGQADADQDRAGDECDADDDNDGVADASDNCPTSPNANQQNTDGGPEGDACDTDDDGDGVADTSDNCGLVANADQADFDGDTWGDVCDSDDDRDALADTAEPASGCTSGGGRLDPDCDNDNVSDGSADPDGAGQIVAGPDNCVTTPNTDQADLDQDGKGNACDLDDDGDLVYDIDETPCGADPLNPNSRPERTDGPFPGGIGSGFDDDGDYNPVTGTGIDEPLPAGAENFDCDGDGYKGIVESGSPLCSGSANDDAFDDAVVNDGCPAQGAAGEGSCSDAIDNDGDTFVNDGCPMVGTWAEGGFNCSDLVNSDVFDDSVLNDGCPARGAPETSCSDAADNDTDGFVNDGCPVAGTRGEDGFNIGTSDQDPCGNDGWPAELAGGDNKIDDQDMDSFASQGHLNTSPPNPNFDKRWDLVPGKGIYAQFINIQDMSSLFAGATGYPPMLGGVKAYKSGLTCPWP